MKEWEVFEKSPLTTKDKLCNFAKYVRRQDIARFIALYKLFEEILNIKGSIVECGVHLDGGLLAFAKFSANFEPLAIHRKIIGFDTFEGFKRISQKDYLQNKKFFNFKSDIDIVQEIMECIKSYDDNRFLNQWEKVEIVQGDATKTIPKYVKNNPHLVVALLFLDFDLYEPTLTALKYLGPLGLKVG